MRVLCILFSHFHLQCEVGRRPILKDRQVLILYAAGSQKLVLDFSAPMKGIQQDMPVQEALAKYGDADILHADVPYYSGMFNQIQDVLQEKSPLVEGSGLGRIYIGLEGMEWLYPTTDALLDAVREAIPAGFKFQLGIAEGKFPSYIAALSSAPGTHHIVSPDGESVFLKDFSCSVLPVSWQNKKRLSDFGLITLGQLASLEAGPLQAQFGPEGIRMWQLARGRDEEPLRPRNSEDVIEGSLDLPSLAVSVEAIMAGIDSLVARALLHKEMRGRGIRNLVLWFQVQGWGYWERNIPFKDPATGAKQALSRIKYLLEISPIPGPVEQIGLKISGFCQPRGRQSSLFSETRAQEQLQEDIRQLELRLGMGPQVFNVREVEPWSRIPERRRALTPSNQ